MKMGNITKITNTLARDSEGRIQITFTIPKTIVEAKKEEAFADLAKEVTLPGFRKGKAPKDKLLSKISETSLLEKTLSKILPQALADAINQYRLKLAIYPKIELINVKDGEDWQVRAVTCEVPEVDLGDYKKTVLGAVRSSSIWTPDKKVDPKKEVPKEEKEQEVIKALLETIKVKIPSLLIKEETDVKLASLLSRIEKLGLTLESYLTSTGKKAEDLRQEYEKQAEAAISLDLILEKIAQDQNVKVEETQVDEVIKASGSDKNLQTPEQRRLILGILRRRKALDSLVSLL